MGIGIMKRLFYILVICLTASLSWSETLYVDGAAGGGGDGTSGTPWTWVEGFTAGNWGAGAGNVSPGDTLCLSGTFSIGSGSTIIPNSGSDPDYVTIDGTSACGSGAATVNPTYGSSAAIYATGKSWLEIKNITFGGGSPRLIVFVNVDNFLIHDNTINGSYYRGIYIQSGSSNGYIYENTVTSTLVGTGADGIKLHVNGASAMSSFYIYNNTISDWNHTGLEVLSYTGDAAVSTVHIHDNYFTLPNRGYGRAIGLNSDTDGNVSGIYAWNNFIDGMRQSTQINSIDDVYFWNNVFYNTQNCCKSAGDTGCVEAYSNCTDDGTGNDYTGTGQHLSIETAYGGNDNVNILGNVFYKSAESAILINDRSENNTNINVKNNIIVDSANKSDHTGGYTPQGSDETECDYDICDTYDGVYSTGITFENNSVYNSARSDTYKRDGTARTIAALDAAFAWADSNLSSDPLMTDPDNDDFTLQSGSPAIDSGQDLDSGSTFPNFNYAWDPDSKGVLPPNTVVTDDQDTYTPWEIGVYFYDAGAPAPSTSSIQGVSF